MLLVLDGYVSFSFEEDMAVDPLLLAPNFVSLLTTSLHVILLAGIFMPFLSSRVSSINADEKRKRQFVVVIPAVRTAKPPIIRV